MKKFLFPLCAALLFLCSALSVQWPEGFAYIQDQIPTVKLDIRYYGNDNFVGQNVNGYKAPKAIATVECIAALKEVQTELKSKGLGLIIYDAYRPQKAVDHFKRWANEENDTLTKAKYYPNLKKSELIPQHYIASKSSHSRGSTVDVGLIDLSTQKTIDMGTGWDYFGPESWPTYKGITEEQYENRMTLAAVMKKAGFKPYSEEWWHFTLKSEPYPSTYFDFDVE